MFKTRDDHLESPGLYPQPLQLKKTKEMTFRTTASRQSGGKCVNKGVIADNLVSHYMDAGLDAPH